MSTSTHFTYLNANHPEFIAAKNAPEGSEDRENWDSDFGPIADRPGAPLDDDDGSSIVQTDDEYGGWIIDLSKVPKGATHLLVCRY